MELPTLLVFTHDAMGDGEDGPTHQPVEQLASLRAIPGLVTLRPGDANEVVEAYRYVLQLRHEPAVLVLSRQALPTLDRSRYAPASGLARGNEGRVIGMRTFGASAPLKELQKKFGFEPDHVAAAAKELLAKRSLTSRAHGGRGKVALGSWFRARLPGE